MRIVFLFFALLLLVSCAKSERRYVVGVSQCSEDIWRDKLNDELRIGAYYYNNVDLRIASANDNDRRQIAQIDRFVREGVDLLIVSPNQVHTISSALDRAYDAGIPIILFDRKTDSRKYTAFIGADNYAIGHTMGQHVATQLRGRGRVVEVLGLEQSSPALERHQGFADALKSYPDIRIVASVHADWLEATARTKMDSLLRTALVFDAVVGQNDRMTAGARAAVEAHGIGRQLHYFGIDALPVAGGGLEQVRDGRSDASFLYPTRGDLVMKLAMDILEKKPFRRDNYLPTALVTKENASLLLMQHEELRHRMQQIATLHARVDTYFTQYHHQKVYLSLLIAIFLLLVGFLFWIYRYFLLKHRIIEATTDAKLRFFTDVSHEIRTPLTLIADPVEQLLDDANLPHEQRRLLAIAHKNTRILLRLVGEILDFRKIQEGNTDLRLDRFDVGEQLREWVSSFQPMAQKRGVVLRLEAPQQAWATADRYKVERMCYNLLSNAMKFTPRGGEIVVALTLTDATFSIEVSDTGQGIDDKQLPHVFDRFYRAKNNIAGGTGIGLAIVKAYAEIQGGTVLAESRRGCGATFTLTLPLKVAAPAPSAPPAAAPDPSLPELLDEADSVAQPAPSAADCITRPAPAEERSLVLVVDDETHVRDYLTLLLAPTYEVATAPDAATALVEARRRVPDLVVSDVAMPGADGLSLCRNLKTDRITSHIPVVLLTGNALDSQRAEGYDCGADAYLTKPFNGRVLRARIQNLLDNRRLLKHLFSAPDAHPDPSPDPDTRFLNAFRENILLHLADESFSVETLSAEMGMSRVQLYRKVKALTGTTPVELIRITRLKRAEVLLRSPGRSVAEVAYEVGFSSPSYFTKCFKDYFRRLPGQR